MSRKRIGKDTVLGIERMLADGASRADVADWLGIELGSLSTYLTLARRMLKRELPGEGKKKSGGLKGHKPARPPTPEQLAARRAKLEALDAAPRSPCCGMIAPCYCEEIGPSVLTQQGLGAVYTLDNGM